MLRAALLETDVGDDVVNSSDKTGSLSSNGAKTFTVLPPLKLLYSCIELARKGRGAKTQPSAKAARLQKNLLEENCLR